MYYLILGDREVSCFSYDKSIIEFAQELRGGEVVFLSLPLFEVLSIYSNKK